MSKLSVTIVIPVLDREGLLPRLFSSLEAVTYRPLEVMLVDNGSKDGSLELCNRFARESMLPVTVLTEPERGANRARNLGLLSCHTEWVYFFDSDDELSPDFLDVLAPQARGCDLVAFPTQMEIGGKLVRRSLFPSLSPARQLLSASLNTQGMLLRTAFLRQTGGWDERASVWQDWELGFRLLHRKAEVKWYTARAFHILHQHNGSITQQTDNFERIQTMKLVLETPGLTSAEQRALNFRSQLLAGQTGEDVHLPLAVSLATRCVGRLLKLYTRLGLRGAWRMAMLFV